MAKTPEWIVRGKSLEQLMRELASFPDPTIEVRLSFDDGATSLPISLVAQQGGACVLAFCGDEETATRSRRRHG